MKAARRRQVHLRYRDRPNRKAKNRADMLLKIGANLTDVLCMWDQSWPWIDRRRAKAGRGGK